MVRKSKGSGSRISLDEFAADLNASLREALSVGTRQTFEEFQRLNAGPSTPRGKRAHGVGRQGAARLPLMETADKPSQVEKDRLEDRAQDLSAWLQEPIDWSAT